MNDVDDVYHNGGFAMTILSENTYQLCVSERELLFNRFNSVVFPVEYVVSRIGSHFTTCDMATCVRN